jgi:hypothetical protein
MHTHKHESKPRDLFVIIRVHSWLNFFTRTNFRLRRHQGRGCGGFAAVHAL